MIRLFLTSSMLVTLTLSPISAHAKQDPKCAAAVFVCLRDCTKDMKKSQEQCEAANECGTVAQCERPVPFAQADVGGVPEHIQKCDKQLGQDTEECDKIQGRTEAMGCLRAALAKYRNCVKSPAPKPAEKKKAVQ